MAVFLCAIWAYLDAACVAAISCVLLFVLECMQRVDSLEKTLMLGGIGGRRRRGQQRKRWLDGITDSMDVSLTTPRSLPSLERNIRSRTHA